MEPDDAGVRNLLAGAGIDVQRDVGDILIASVGDSENHDSLIIAHGQFHPDQFITAAAQHGASVAGWHSVQIVTIKTAKDEAAIAFPDAATALVGSTEMVRAAADRVGAPSVLPAGVEAKVRELSAAYDAWFLSNGPPGDYFAGMIADENLGDAVHGNLLSSVLDASGGLKFEAGGVRFEGVATTRSEKDSSALRDVVKFLAGLVQTSKGPGPKTTLADSLQATADGNALRLSLSMPEPVVEQLFLKAQTPKPGQPARRINPH
jgi:hypothetical protein